MKYKKGDLIKVRLQSSGLYTEPYAGIYKVKNNNYPDITEIEQIGIYVKTLPETTNIKVDIIAIFINNRITAFPTTHFEKV